MKKLIVTVYISELESVNDLDIKESSTVWTQKIIVNENEVDFKLASESKVNVIPKSELLK